MRPFVAVFLLVLFSWPLLVKGGIWLWYWSNKDYIASTLCQNRDIQDTLCSGKCVVIQYLASVDESSATDSNMPLQVALSLNFSNFLEAIVFEVPDRCFVQHCNLVMSPVQHSGGDFSDINQPPPERV